MHRRLLKDTGFTLIELVIAIVVVSIALSMLILLTSKSTERSVDPMIQEQGNAIAQAYLEEIMQKEFCDPNWDHDSNPVTALDCPAQCGNSVCTSCSGTGTGWTTETRATYDDICDYDGITDSPPEDQTGSGFATLNQYTVTVQVIDDAGGNLNTLTATTGQSARIDVTVAHPAMQADIQISGFRANF